MKFSEVVQQASALLQDKGQVSYRMLKREFSLDDEELADLRAELIEVDGLAADKDGTMLVWMGGAGLRVSEPKQTASTADSQTERLSDSQRSDARPIYTPKHLAEKILHSKSALEGEHKQVTVLFA